jgi:integrase
MSMGARKIKKRWYADFRVEYTRYRIPSPENTKAGAGAYEAVLRQKLARGEQIDKTDNLQELLFEQFAWKWFETYVMPNNKYSERRRKKYVLTASLVPFFGKMPISTITAYQIEQFKAKKLKAGLAPKTINNHLSVLRTCLDTAYDWLKIDVKRPQIKWLKCPPPQTDYLSDEECELLLFHAKGVVYEMVLTALRTGMRQGELKGLQWSSIDWENRSLVVRHSRNDYTKLLESPKSNRERHIPLADDIYDMLYQRKKSTGHVFLDTDGQQFDHRRLGRRMAELCKKAQLRKIGWHTLRHTFATHHAMNGAPLNVVQALLGHSTIATTMRYAHVTNTAMRDAIDTLNAKQVYKVDFGQPVGNHWIGSQQKEAIIKNNVSKNA